MVGSAIIRRLRSNGYKNIIGQSHAELDLINQAAVNKFFLEEKPDQVYIAAAKVGGIHANNTYPADFIYENLMIQSNVIHHAFIHGVKKLLFLGSSCIYPRLALQPINEDALLTGKLEPTNEPYAIAKIAGIKMCESYSRQYGKSHEIDYRSVMPTNLYGPGDNYHPENSHVIPALIRRFHDAKTNQHPKVVIWGTGEPRREFLHVDDLAAASIFIMELNKSAYKAVTSETQSHLNIGFGSDVSISELAKIISEIVSYEGRIHFDLSKPDGSPRKLLNLNKINHLGWRPKIDLYTGLKKTYQDYLINFNNK
jgi:GDP-L-fucose synthase